MIFSFKSLLKRFILCHVSGKCFLLNHVTKQLAVLNAHYPSFGVPL